MLKVDRILYNGEIYTLAKEGLYQLIKKAYEEGNDIAIHMTGDAAIDPCAGYYRGHL